MTQSVHKDVINKLEEVLEVVKVLPQGYQYKVRELCACIETVVSMYDDVQKGIIPEVLVKMRDSTLEVPKETETEQVVPAEVPVETKKKLTVGEIRL